MKKNEIKDFVEIIYYFYVYIRDYLRIFFKVNKDIN